MTLAELSALAVAQGWAGGAHWYRGTLEIHHVPNPDLDYDTAYHVTFMRQGETEQDAIDRTAVWLRAHHCRDAAPHLYAAYNPEAVE